MSEDEPAGPESPASETAGPRNASAPRLRIAPTLWPYLVAAALTVVLVLPGFVYPYLFDDYGFLVRALRFTPASLFPDPSVIFYRPVSRDLQFLLLQTLSPNSPALAHALNSAYLVAATWLVVFVGTRALGRREGALSGIYFAAFAQIPLLVAWASGAQDALAILFTLVALALECRRRHGMALLAVALAILSKETAVAALPALAMAHLFFRDDHVDRGGDAARSGRWAALDYLILGIAWGAIHPAVHALAQRGFGAGSTGYIGLGGSWPESLLRYTTLLFNLPSPGLDVHWPNGLTIVAAIAVAIAIGAVLLLPQGAAAPAPERGARGATRSRSFAVVAALLAVPPVLASGILVRNWAPYYVAFSGMGVAWLLAMWTARFDKRALVVVVALYVAAGVYVRGMTVPPGVTSEKGLAPAASALLRLEPQFRALAPTIPKGAQILVANEVTGAASVHTHLYDVPTLQQWYRDPTLHVTGPELRQRGAPAELLFWINRELNLYRIDLASYLPRSVTKAANFEEYQGVMRRYTRGLAESGDLNQAVGILLGMPHRRESVRWWDRRLAASYLFAFGRFSEAQAILKGAPPIEKSVAVTLVVELLAQRARIPRYDVATMNAFGLDDRDPDAIRRVMRPLAALGNDASARLALRLVALVPTDREARAVLEKFAARRAKERIVPEAPSGDPAAEGRTR